MSGGVMRRVVLGVWLGCFTASAAHLVPESAGPAEAQPAPDCGRWNTATYFQAVTEESVTTCLKAGADLTARDKDGRFPLHYAAAVNKNPAVIEALLKAGAAPKARARAHDKGTPLHWAADSNENLAAIEALLAARADLNARDDDKETPLHRAARSNENPAAIKALLKAGADPKARNKKARTRLQVSRKGNRKVLEDAGARRSE